MGLAEATGTLVAVTDGVAPSGPGWWRDRRATSRAAFAARGLPTPREERWRFLPLGGLEGPFWRPAAAPAAAAGSQRLLPDAHLVSVVDGRIVGECPQDDGIRVGRLADLAEVAEGRLGAIAARGAENPFLDLATALAEDVLVIEVAAGCTDARIEWRHEAVAADAVSAPRLLVVLGAGASLTLVEHYGSAGVDARLVLPVLEAELASAARLDHIRLQAEGPATRVFAASAVRLAGEQAVYHGTVVQTGGRLLRHDLDAQLTAPRTEATLNGLVRVGERSVVDNHTRIEHLAPHTTSHELYKVVLSERARSVFNGRILVAQNAQKTNAYQANPNLLLSTDAVANSNPELEIYADDVRCTHGATYGDLDQTALFYLRSRGIPREAAEALLIEAFAGEVLDAVASDELRAALRAASGTGGAA